MGKGTDNQSQSIRGPRREMTNPPPDSDHETRDTKKVGLDEHRAVPSSRPGSSYGSQVEVKKGVRIEYKKVTPDSRVSEGFVHKDDKGDSGHSRSDDTGLKRTERRGHPEMKNCQGNAAHQPRKEHSEGSSSRGREASSSPSQGSLIRPPSRRGNPTGINGESYRYIGSSPTASTTSLVPSQRSIASVFLEVPSNDRNHEAEEEDKINAYDIVNIESRRQLGGFDYNVKILRGNRLRLQLRWSPKV
ncbi:hypothetical protein PNOK_0327300 [Pyrrhoderma noxium]|uniref:Uncharacterized protein n=1 Tax=Pyrrhoderma noxium TaxID=2282107 RepID=A0A286UM06_9AGAM|nr:hypothetical protein PNOK_0327300 [Pyrrhoderma noxium]